MAIPSGQFTAVRAVRLRPIDPDARPAGLDTIDRGQVLLGDTDLSKLNEKQRMLQRHEHIGFVFQSFFLVVAAAAMDDVERGAKDGNIKGSAMCCGGRSPR